MKLIRTLVRKKPKFMFLERNRNFSKNFGIHSKNSRPRFIDNRLPFILDSPNSGRLIYSFLYSISFIQEIYFFAFYLESWKLICCCCCFILQETKKKN